MSSWPHREIGTPSFGADDGSAEPRVEAALAAFASGAGGSADVVAALSTGRLLVPVVAVLDEERETELGLRTEKSSHLATVLTTGRDGRRGLLAFTSTATMRRWNPAARPVPVTTRRAAESALSDGAAALVVDIAGPVVFSVDAADLRALASGWRPVADGLGGTAWAVAVGLASVPQPDSADAPAPERGALDRAGDAASSSLRSVAAHARAVAGEFGRRMTSVLRRRRG